MFNGSSDATSSSSSSPPSPPTVTPSGNNALATPVGTPNSSAVFATGTQTKPPVFESLYSNYVTPSDEFSDLSKYLFLAYYDIYQNTVKTESATITDGTPFYVAPFEFGGNRMEGTYRYATLAKRLEVIRQTIEKETQDWIKMSHQWIASSSRMSSNLARQFEQIREYYRENDTGGVEVQLVDNNPFVWTFTIFGKPMR